MSQGLNQVNLIGNVGMDPELKFTNSGQAVLRLRVATNKSWLDKSGKKMERTEWHTVIVWGKRAEGLNKVLEKGSGVWIVGELQTRSWEKEGAKHYATEIVASDLGFTGSGRRQGEGRDQGGRGGYEAGQGGRTGQGGGSSYGQAEPAGGGYGAPAGQGDFGYGDGNDEDQIPF